MQNILVLVIEGEHAGVVLSQSFEDVEMAVCGGKVQRRAPLLENKLGRTQVFKAPPEYPWHQRLRQVPLVSKSESSAAGRGVESPSGDFLAWKRGGEG